MSDVTERVSGSAMPECCAKAENQERFETTNPFAYILRCQVCGRNHYHLRAQPVALGAKLPQR